VLAKDLTRTRSEESEIDQRPLLLVDIDGVISLFARDLGAGGAAPLGAPARAGAPLGADPDGLQVAGSLHSIDGMLHYLSATAARHLLALERVFELVWASGWEEKADEHLPHLLGVPAGMPFLHFAKAPRGRAGEDATRAPRAPGHSLDAHWKLEAVDAYAGDRALAWIDDAFNDACYAWAAARGAPTLLVSTEPERGLTDAEALLLEGWAAQLSGVNPS
jgi:hypothetical protein